MARPKKELVPSAPLNRASSLVARMQHGGGSIVTASQAMDKWKYIDFANPRCDLPTLTLEWCFGARGLLAGRIMQLRATYSKGKSSFMYYMYACAQLRNDAYCFHVETEGAAAPPDFVASFGCNPDNLAIAEISSLEECLGRIDEVIREIRGGGKGSIDPETGRNKKSVYTDPLDPTMTAPLIVGIDSLSSLGIESKVEQDIMDMTKRGGISAHTLVLRDYFRNRVGLYRDTQTLAMFATHETAKIETGVKSFGGPKKSSLAQEAIAIHGTYAADFDSNKWVDKEAGEQIGSKISIFTTKNKLSPRYRKVEMFMRNNLGFDLLETDVNFLVSHASSPFTKDECKRVNGGIKCTPLNDKTFKSNEEFLRALYGHTDLIMSLREKLRIRGYGFKFETDYQAKLTEQEMAALAEGRTDIATEEEPSDGVDGNQG